MGNTPQSTIVGAFYLDGRCSKGFLEKKNSIGKMMKWPRKKGPTKTITNAHRKLNKHRRKKWKSILDLNTIRFQTKDKTV